MGKLVGCVGSVCIDIVSVCNKFPLEDSEQRVQGLHWQRGGNASNTAVVLALLGSGVEFIGHLPDCKQDASSLGYSAAAFVIHDLERHGVGLGHVVRCNSDDLPTSMVMINAQNGSRTIMHHRGCLPEMRFEDFPKLNLDKFCWVHFEGRPNLDMIIRAMQMIKRHNDDCQTIQDRVFVSLELEKPREIFFKSKLNFLKLPDLVFVSKSFATYMGHDSAVEAVTQLKVFLKDGAGIICSWGSDGAAFGRNFSSCTAKHLDARTLGRVVDTLGAGDCFAGAVIHAMSKGRLLEESAELGMRVVEKKITDFGFDHLGEMPWT